MDTNKVWFITGCSTGFGRALAKKILLSGGKATITARKLSDIQDFANDFPDALVLSLDVTNTKLIKNAVDETKKKFGRIDVLVNNAGYGVAGAIEEVPDAEVRKLFDANVFGLIDVIREVLPIMRAQQSGHIINMSCLGGMVAVPGLGLYNASKFAVEGLSEALAQEVEPLGIKVTQIEPGPSRTDFISRSLRKFEGISDYDGTRGMICKVIDQYDGIQPGDPEKAAEAIMQIVDHPIPPLHLPLGKFAIERIREKMANVTETISTWEEVSSNVDFEK